MAFKFFKISSDDVSAQEDLNDFLRKENKIITKTKEFYQGIWYFTIEYIPSSYTPAKPDSVKKGKEIKDYAEILPPEQFKIYSKLRDCRSVLAQERSCPVYVIFTNEQLAELARGKDITTEALKNLKGFGEGKFNQYAARFLQILEAKNQPFPE